MKNKINSQTAAVLNYLKTHKKGITSMDAIELFGATRLSAIIFNLRHKGYKINALEEVGKNRYGRRVTFSRYKLVG